MGGPKAEQIGDTYRFTWEDIQVGIDVERIRESEGDLWGDIIVKSYREPRPGLLADGREKITGPRTMANFAKMLSDKEPGIDWPEIVTHLASLVRQRWRQGEPLIDLRSVDIHQRPRWLLPPFIEYGGPTVLYGDGGGGKSSVLLGLGFSVASGVRLIGDAAPTQPLPVMYLDWETDAVTHAQRLWAIRRGCGFCDDCEHDGAFSPACGSCYRMQPIYYRWQAASLAETAHDLAKQVGELGIGLVMVDSLGPARGGDLNSGELTLATFAAARTLRVPVIFTDHVTKVDAASHKASRPTGSGKTHDAARNTWLVDKAQDPGSDILALALTHTKSNNGRLQPRRGYRLRFVNDGDELRELQFSHMDIKESPELLSRSGLGEQILAALIAGARSVKDLADDFSTSERPVSVATIRTTLNRLKPRVVSLQDGLWGLSA